MTESFNKKAGEYVLNFFKIYKLDNPDQFIEISRLVHQWEINESMNSGHIRGSASIYDSVGLLDRFLGERNGWIKGEEEVEIEYTDFFQEKRRDKFFVYAITNLKTTRESNETVYSYTLHFVSKEKFYSERTLIRRTFGGGLISEYANTVFNEYFNSEKEIDIEPETLGQQTLVVPNYSPEETMHFLTRKAVSSEYDSQTFRFFESREGYFFGTMEYLVSQFFFDEGNDIPIFVKRELPDQTTSGQIELMSTIISLEYPNYINTIQDMVEGSYYSQTIELDFLNRTTLFNEYRYLDEYQDYYSDMKSFRSKHSKKFVDEHMNYARNTVVVKDYVSDGMTTNNRYRRPNTYYPKSYNNKNVNLYHHQNESFTVTIYGRNTITVGDVIELQLNEVNFNVENRERDRKRTGYYLIESIRNVFYEDQYQQILTVSRSGFLGQPESGDQYDREPQTENVFDQSGDTASSDLVATPTSIDTTLGQTPEDRQEVYEILRDQGLDHEKAIGVLANINRESGFRPGAAGDSGQSFGLFQYYGGTPRRQAFTDAVPDWQTNARGQIEYAINQDPLGVQYANRDFTSSVEAANWFTNNFEIPANRAQYTSPGGYNESVVAELEQTIKKRD